MQAHKLKIVIPEDHRLFVEVPEEVPAGPAELIVLVELPPEEVREPAAEEARRRLEALEDRLRADPRPFRDLSREEREARLREVVGVGRGLFSSSDEFARRKQEEISLEAKRFAR